MSARLFGLEYDRRLLVGSANHTSDERPRGPRGRQGIGEYGPVLVSEGISTSQYISAGPRVLNRSGIGAGAGVVLATNLPQNLLNEQLFTYSEVEIVPSQGSEHSAGSLMGPQNEVVAPILTAAVEWNDPTRPPATQSLFLITRKNAVFSNIRLRPPAELVWSDKITTPEARAFLRGVQSSSPLFHVAYVVPSGKPAVLYMPAYAETPPVVPLGKRLSVSAPQRGSVSRRRTMRS